MRNPNRAVIWIALLIMNTGCATVGQDFAYNNINRLDIGSSDVGEYESLFGKPSSTQTIVNENGSFRLVRYVYASGNLAGATARSLSLEFKGSVLNSYIYNSSFENDSTNFDFEAVSKITIGESSEADVIACLGMPNGKGNCPNVIMGYKGECNNGSKMYAWVHTAKLEGTDKRNIKSKTVIVVLDETGKVRDIQASKQH